ncbi:hypothetical protein J3E69DRAFT_353859 [Trichoderma sp. SZMC 28015]
MDTSSSNPSTCAMYSYLYVPGRVRAASEALLVVVSGGHCDYCVECNGAHEAIQLILPCPARESSTAIFVGKYM